MNRTNNTILTGLASGAVFVLAACLGVAPHVTVLRCTVGFILGAAVGLVNLYRRKPAALTRGGK